MNVKKVKTVMVKESSSEYFQRLRPKFLDWQPPTEEEHAQAVREQRAAREAVSEKVIALAKTRQAEKEAMRRRNKSEVAKKR